jgi:hypothetical protein
MTVREVYIFNDLCSKLISRDNDTPILALWMSSDERLQDFEKSERLAGPTLTKIAGNADVPLRRRGGGAKNAIPLVQQLEVASSKGPDVLAEESLVCNFSPLVTKLVFDGKRSAPAVPPIRKGIGVEQALEFSWVSGRPPAGDVTTPVILGMH